MELTRSQEVDFSCSLRARITCRSYEFTNSYSRYSVVHDLHRMELFYKFPREKTAASTTSFQLATAPVPHRQFPLSAVDLSLMDPGVNALNIWGTFLLLNSSASFSNCATRFERTCCCSSLVSRHDQEQTTPEYWAETLGTLRTHFSQTILSMRTHLLLSGDDDDPICQLENLLLCPNSIQNVHS